MTSSLLLMSLYAQGYSANSLTDALALQLLAAQQKNGSWSGFDQRPPSEYSAFSETAYAIRAIQSYMPPGRRRDTQAKVKHAVCWLLSEKPRATEEEVMQLLGLGWSNIPRSRLRKLALKLMSQQKDDGGWAQRDGFSSDAYATGEVLYALNQAAQVPTSSRAYQKGVRYLLNSQFSDGSWYVKSRSVPFQPYFESGFPHGHDQWISAAATCWAGTALALTFHSGLN